MTTMDGAKLDAIQETVTELRVSVATLSGDVRASLGRHDGHDTRSEDVERRIRILERRNFAVPSMAVLVSAGSLAVALYSATH